MVLAEHQLPLDSPSFISPDRRAVGRKLAWLCPSFRWSLNCHIAAPGVPESPTCGPWYIADMGLGEHLQVTGRILFPIRKTQPRIIPVRVQIRGIMMDLPNFTPHVCAHVHCQCPAH